MNSRTPAAVAIAAITTVFNFAAHAGTCPEGAVLEDPRMVEQMPDVGVERPILAEVDLTGWRDMGNFMLRLRMLTVAPGGIVPTHEHSDRPSIVHIVSGEIIEHNSFCSEPILHVAGSTTPEFGEGHAHWWENKTDQPVILFSTDVVPFEMRNDVHM